MTSPKSRKKKPYSPPSRAGPSASRQAASRSKRNKLNLEQLMENTLDGNKLPDLVVNREPSEAFSAVTNDQTTAVPYLVVNQELLEILNVITNDQMPDLPDVETTGQSDGELKGITDTPLANLSTPVTAENTELPTETIAPVTPENMEFTQDNTNDTNKTNTPAPVGHDTATTDEEEAIEALLALSNLPDMDDEGNGSDDNATLMPIDGPSSSIDVNPVKVKLSTDDISQAIKQLPLESRLEVASQTTQADANENSPETDPRPTANQDNSLPNSPMKGTLKVKNYDLKKSRQSNRTYRCQKCGCKKGSVHDLNEHHQHSHPPLMCSECNKLFNVPSTFQLHMYDHQKRKKIPCETCGQVFSFQGQLDQHKIVHRTIKTHKCMAKDCGRWFMRKANLTVHAETHNKKEYKCDK